MEKEMRIYVAQIDQARIYTKKNGDVGYKYMIHHEAYNNETKRYDKWEHITILSSEAHKQGENIYYTKRRNHITNEVYYVEYTLQIQEDENEELPM